MNVKPGILAYGLLALAASGSAFAQAATTFPCKVVKFIVPYPPGGSSDLLARLLVPGLTQKLSTTIVVENKAGAAGNIGTAQVSSAKADGCTWLLGNSSNIVISRNLYKLQRDPVEALTPVAEVAAMPMVLYVNAQLPATDMKQLASALRANPGQYSYASPGSGTTHHLLGEKLKLDLSVSATHVPYRGSGPAIQDVLGGSVSFAFEGTSAIIPHLAGAKIRALATTGEQRSPGLPHVPTMKELGYPGFVVTNWYGVFVPQGTPAALVEQLNISLRETMKAPQIAEALGKFDSLNSDYSAQQYRKFVQKEAPYWESLVKQTGAKVD
ncbi:tripartite-type tricarboxylate transporter receptor subunit TctC [Comamonas sp. BIGb0152]|uniref:Bug family tripartite tricarboxylate transporter substrate binding protein n=1 Tax=Comamonas sp. BIGb0152 TaxID=2940601 RepID=UPI0021698D4D|nr:tripartite tricarboxylate transporter substrate binding protein [Comamonas sp. BIGb0152]MCS4296262.1 tripartite-type tricarboxylate transporter receptor subunit TctC [Comamonas sp. BIGb0152]